MLSTDPTVTGDTPTSGGTGSATEAGTGVTTANTDGGSTGFKFDLGDDTEVGQTSDSGPGVPSCKVGEDMDATQPCADKAQPDSFDPEVQWSWMGDAGESQAFSIPLVANLNDDNGDGAIDLCDTPDIVIQVFAIYGQWAGSLHVLDGATGTPHWKAPVQVDTTITPALGDLDADGIPEIVAMTPTGNLVCFEHDGTLKWTAASAVPNFGFGAIGMSDLDNDGSAEVLVVSNESYVAMQTAPALQVIRDKGDRWIPARRIWNQHTYHVTNVREDGTIPQFEKPHWKGLNTYRTQAHVGVGGTCKPMPPG